MNRLASSLSRLFAATLLLLAILAFIAIMWPISVLVGLFLLFIPGIILIIAPTLFLWASLFCAPWFATRVFLRAHRSEGLATLPAVGIPAALGIATFLIVSWDIVAPSRSLAEARLEAYALPNVTPKSRIKLHGNVRLDFDKGVWATADLAKINGREVYACDANCIWLLSDGGADSVTVNANPNRMEFAQVKRANLPLSPAAMTYQLRPKGMCDGDIPDMEFRAAPYWFRRQAQASTWQSKVRNQSCIQAIPIQRSHDFLLRAGDLYVRGDSDADPWTRTPSGMDAEFSEIRNADGKILMRDYRLSTKALMWPIAIDYEPIFDRRHGWVRQNYPNDLDKDTFLKYKILFRNISR